MVLLLCLFNHSAKEEEASDLLFLTDIYTPPPLPQTHPPLYAKYNS
jgi:hypothetical protein